MEKFSAEVFFSIGRTLQELKTNYGRPSHANELFAPQDFTIPLLSALAQRCLEVGLRVSWGMIWDVKTDIEKGELKLSRGEFANKMEGISETIRVEMSLSHFLYLSERKASFYNQPELFGENVAAKFPSANYDTMEAGNCFAAARSTACVFHLMRVLEIALGCFGKAPEINVSVEHTNWHNAIEQMESKIRAMGKASKTSAEKELHEFYSQAASSFMFFKDAWRNYTAHARGRYTEEEAETILINVRAFTQKLAEKLSE